MLTKLRKAAAAALPRPPQAEVEPVALELIRRYGAEIMATARRYALSREDAEDAYQRGLEILLTKAPSTSEDHLLPWLKTVVKHEAYALRRQRERVGPAADAPDVHPSATHVPDTHDHVEQLERLQMGAEAMGRLKAPEVRCMLLLAEGHSYRQIQEITGFSYTKVNRSLTEGRRSFLLGVERIESGAECERLAPLLSALADGEATAKDMAALRPHLRTCLSCRAALRDAREVPARVAALAPVGLFAAAGHAPAGLGAALRSAGAWLHDRATLLVMRVQDVGEVAASHKLAAAAASAAALGGGGIATVEVSGSHPERGHRERPVVVARPAAAAVPAPVATRWRPAGTVAVPRRAAPAREVRRQHQTHRRHRAQAAPAPQPTPTTASGPPTAPPVRPATRVGPAPPPRRRRDPPPPEGTTGEFGP
jgi:RNA polymerase sigma factor (sigma-70 family)